MMFGLMSVSGVCVMVVYLLFFRLLLFVWFDCCGFVFCVVGVVLFVCGLLCLVILLVVDELLCLLCFVICDIVVIGDGCYDLMM